MISQKWMTISNPKPLEYRERDLISQKWMTITNPKPLKYREQDLDFLKRMITPEK